MCINLFVIKSRHMNLNSRMFLDFHYFGRPEWLVWQSPSAIEMERRYLFIFLNVLSLNCVMELFHTVTKKRPCMLCKSTSPVGLFLLFFFCLPVTKFVSAPDGPIAAQHHVWSERVTKKVADGRKASPVLSANFEAHVTPLFIASHWEI